MANEHFNPSTANWTPAVGDSYAFLLSSVNDGDACAEIEMVGTSDTEAKYAAGQQKTSGEIGFVGSGGGMRAGDEGGLTITEIGGTLTCAVITRFSVRGSLNQAITGSITVRPTAGTPVVDSPGDPPEGIPAFNGTTITFGSLLTNVISASYDETCAEIAITTSDPELVKAGIPQKSFTVTILGTTLLAAGDEDALAVVWTDGGTAGSMADAVLIGKPTTGSLNGQTTTTFTFRPLKVEPA